MKSMFRSLVVAFFLVATATYAGDGSTPVTQVGSRLDAAQVATATAAVNTAVVLTINAGPGCIYITELDFTISEDGTGATDSWTNLSFVTAGLGGSGWQYTFSAATAAANTTPLDKAFIFAMPLKGLPGTKVTITSPTNKTHSIYNINASYYYAPCS